jgi:methionyl-tRNA formyltransferase
VIFFGTPEFAVPTLAAMCRADLAPALVVSQPARRVGRGRQLSQPPVAEWALQQGLAVDQPASVRDPDFVRLIQGLAPAALVVVAYGQIFPKILLEIPLHGCINLHASLLPRYRGAAPIQAAIMAGETVTGVTTMLMEEGLDSGPILLQEEAPIGGDETAGELAPRLAEQGAALMVRTLGLIEAGQVRPRPQQHELATFAPRLRKSDGEVDWSQPAPVLFNRLRGLMPWPGLFSLLRERPVKIVWGSVSDSSAGLGEHQPGTFRGLEGDSLLVDAGDGTTFGIEQLQRPGKRVLSAREFLNGERLRTGERFG